MRKRVAVWIFTFLSVCLSSMLFQAQAQSVANTQVQILNIESGLSQSWVMALHVDKYGFLWVGTQGGLNRYDGYSFKKYKSDPLDAHSLSNNAVTSICEDKDGNLWVGTSDGLSFLDRQTGQFTNYYYDANDSKSLSDNRIYSVFYDSKDVLWVKTLESLDRFNEETNTFDRYPHISSPFTSPTYQDSYSLFEDSKGRFWAASKDGLLLFDRDLGVFSRFESDPSDPQSLSSNNVRDIVEDPDGNIWIATANGLNRLSENRYGFNQFYAKSGGRGLVSNDIHSLLVDSKGVLWIATDKGMCTYKKGEGFIPQTKLGISSDIYSISITSMIKDRSGVMWMGGYSGLIKWNLNSQKFPAYGKDHNDRNFFGNNLIASVHEHTDGKLWVGTWHSGLYLFNRKNLTSLNYSSSQSYPYHIPANDVHAISVLHDETVLLGSSNGVYRFNPRTQSFEDYFAKQGLDTQSLFHNKRIYAVLEDSDRNIWVAQERGLFKFDGKELFHFQHNPLDSTTLSSSQIQCLAEDGHYLWVGTNSGLNKIDRHSLVISRYNENSNRFPRNCMLDDILSLHVDSRHNVWVGTDLGLIRLNSASEECQVISEKEGLPDNTIYAIQEDDNGDIWVSTNLGLARISLPSYSISSFGVSDGLQDYEFNIGVVHKASDGELFFGGVSGINAFYPDSITSTDDIPALSFTQLEVITPSGRTTLPLEATQEVIIKQPFSLVNFEFALLDFDNPDYHRFMYKLEGSGKDEWIQLNNRHFATFSAIPEGRYTLRVLGANSSGVWSQEGVSIKVTVKNQWWRTRYAFLFYSVIILIGLLLGLLYRFRQQKHNTRLLNERETAIRDAEEQKEQLMLKNKNITDSISYAKRIQEALIPSEIHFKSILPNSFILYMPKDIVSGDFYWIYEADEKIFVASVDCTGHGVPGAFMSIIGIELIRNIISERGINDPAEILNLLDKGIRDTFSKAVNDQTSDVKDGMDVAFCLIDKREKTLQFSGAFSNLYLIRDLRLKEIKGQRYSVGFSYDQQKPEFISHTESLEPDDMIYLFTDGYVDQFGGPAGKKFKFRRFRHLLLSIHRLSLAEQKKYLVNTMKEWKGEKEQVDDILIVGFKPNVK